MSVDIVSVLLGSAVTFIGTVYGMSIRVKLQTKKELNDEIDKHLNYLRDFRIYMSYFQENATSPTTFDITIYKMFEDPELHGNCNFYECITTTEMLELISKIPKGLSKPIYDEVAEYDIISEPGHSYVRFEMKTYVVKGIKHGKVYFRTDRKKYGEDYNIEFYPLDDTIITFESFKDHYHDYIATLIEFREMPLYKLIYTKL